MEHTLQLRLQAAAKSLEASKIELPLSLKIKTAELILRIMSRRKNFGLFVILGWKKKWQEYLDISDSKQDIFADHHIDLKRMRPGTHRQYDVSATVNFDGAILIDANGSIIHSGVFIEGLRPRIVAQKINPGHFTDLSEQFGFDTKVHARHLSAITASYIFKGTTVFTVSEENDSFHIFEGGRIIHHT
jgi:DNA integrity scanning protein DisA with diadenylate cyclase activity